MGSCVPRTQMRCRGASQVAQASAHGPVMKSGRSSGSVPETAEAAGLTGHAPAESTQVAAVMVEAPVQAGSLVKTIRRSQARATVAKTGSRGKRRTRRGVNGGAVVYAVKSLAPVRTAEGSASVRL